VFIFLLFLVTTCMELSAFAGEDRFFGPWGEESFLEESSINEDITEEEGGQFTLSQGFIQMVVFFRDVISPVDGDRCPMYPTCSEYGLQALRKHGPFLGSVMIADRLIHERDEMKYAPRVIVHGICRYYDPLENNDFWWIDEEQD